MEGEIDMAARRQVTNRLRDAYCKDSELERGRILDRVVEATGMGRSTARRMLRGPRLPAPKGPDRQAQCQAPGVGLSGITCKVWLVIGCGIEEPQRTRPSKVIAKVLSASFQRLIHRSPAAPLGSSECITKYRHLNAACSLGSARGCMSPDGTWRSTTRSRSWHALDRVWAGRCLGQLPSTGMSIGRPS
jgi:hypothetical protein